MKLDDVLLIGTRAAQPAAGDVAPGTLYAVNDEDFLIEQSDGSAWTQYGPTAGGGGTTLPGIVQGRLTLTDNTPVTTADVTAATTIYFDAYKGEYAALYTGAAWEYVNIGSGLSIAVPATTNTMYDVWLDYNGGTPQLVVDAWTNDTTRATALTTQDGVYVKTGATDHLYLGSFRTTGVSGQTEDSVANRLLWNYYNRVRRPLRRMDTTNSWTYTLTPFQQANASTANQLGIVQGVLEDALNIRVDGFCLNSTATIRYCYVGIGIDSTTVDSSNIKSQAPYTSTSNGRPYSIYQGFATTVGYHYYAWLERVATAADTTTWFGDNGGTDLLFGLTGDCWG